MKDINKKREEEKIIVAHMISLYCKKNHRSKELCPQCRELLNYAWERSDKCPFMKNKTFCSNCKVHCYKSDMREMIKKVMRYSGPRIIFYHPIKALSHVIESKKEKKKIQNSVSQN